MYTNQTKNPFFKQVNCEKNPFTNKPFFNEVIFYHKPSKSLITTDLYWNYPSSSVTNDNLIDSLSNNHDDDDDNTDTNSDYGVWELAPKVDNDIPIGTKLWKFGMDIIYRPFYVNLMVKIDNEQNKIYNDIVDYILNVWDVNIIVPAHGDVIRGRKPIRDVLSKHFEYKS